MNRRKFLVIGGLGFGTGGYFTWNWYQSPSLPDGMNVDTLYVRGNVFGEPSPEDHQVGPREEHHRIIEDEETAAGEITFGDSAIEFVEETDFDNSYLIIIQTGMQTEPDLALEAISRTDGGLHLDVTVEHPWWRGVNDDLGTHSLLIRVTDEKDDTPELVSVDIEGYV
ncbi:hypothetical protein [Natronococcus pandeyae]|uniref:hypothetical protein n=1 Tax=Natronococcus pandeyae TaxID=2055836 RepID=UPI001F16DFB3|nr:hypothetical protein [Natronococcus pandeyae]